mmetsp:Transcript_107566/g.302831  ORF Transcript_107566/g.302831 Transcript_107566/m.302831 type:complete len:462 (+) Transcript_107566:86-1471(+)|eukprot:CAMPEP_0117531956 /NCGR_PEP_ID=MMETSP0784-20121206/39122_1 /TAXON_ID=39447 /ORGANISM="" /LENGTH=461 /DNA_ID=CAMNT_0005328339 /DNA_START=29 /DNA_END=1414 /DNA_ORIENTATION=-
MEKTAVTCVSWVPRGKCRSKPIANEENEEDELKQFHDEYMGGASSSSAKPAAAATARAVAGDGLEEFNLDKYDDSDDDGGMQLFSVLKTDGELAKERDPYLTGNPDSESDSEDGQELGPNDQVFIAASCEEEDCNLEMYIYDEDEAGMFVHHEVMLSAYPLCIEWLGSTAAAKEGSFAALGLIDHSIQIWDLDRLDPLMPAQVLGEPTRKSAKGKTKKKKRASAAAAASAEAHAGAVLCLHGSPFNRSVLVSGSADHTVKVWDICENSCVHVYTHHEDKVQCGKWHPTEQAVLLSAAFDRKLALLDVRQPGQVAKVALPAEAESALWSRHKPFECFASADNGGVICYDVRKIANKAPEAESIVWSIQAHDVACTAVQDCPTPNLMVTAGLDGEAKVWDLGAASPSLVFSKDLQAGPLFACDAAADAPALMCFGGKCPVIWDLTGERVIADTFKIGDPSVGP